MRCPTCNTLFLEKDAWDNKFCSETCYIADVAGHANNKSSKKFWQICIGITCRGNKKFLTDNKFNRICHNCKIRMEKYLNDK